MADTLTIHGLTAVCRIGVYDWEQKQPQAISIDLELPVDAGRAAGEDQLEDAVDYARLVATVKQLAEGRPYRLIETLAEDIAGTILGEFKVSRVTVRVRKSALPGIGHVAIEIERPKPGEPPPSRRRRRNPSPKAAPR